jgi:hypothetical protein
MPSSGMPPPTATPRDLFIGYATGAPAPDLVRLARALQHHAPSSMLVLFVREPDRARLQRQMEAHCNASAVWLLAGSDANISHAPSAAWVEPGVDHGSFLRRSSMVNNIRRQHLNYVATVRYFHVRRFLLEHRHRFARVVMADTRDVALQADPFAQISERRSVYAFTESTYYGSVPGGFNPTVVRECYGDAFLARILKDKVVNCGVLMGHAGALIGYLDAFVAEFARVGPCAATDTAVNVKVLYEARDSGTPWAARLVHSERAETIHMALPKYWDRNKPLDQRNLTRVRAGEVVRNLDAVPYALIHQADRLGSRWFADYSKRWLKGTGL